MKVYFDENFSPRLAQGLEKLQAGRHEDIEVLHIKDVFGQGAVDEKWIPVVAEEKGIVLTQDLNIHRTRQQWALCQQHGLKIVFFKAGKKQRPNYWEWVVWIIRDWEKLLKAIQSSQKIQAWEVTKKTLRVLGNN